MSVFFTQRRAVLRGATAVVMAGVLEACRDPAPKFKGKEITGTGLGKALEWK